MTTDQTTGARAQALGYAGKEFVAKHAAQLQERYRAKDPSARATLAQLRQATSGLPGTAWTVGEYLVPDFLRDDTAGSRRYGESADDRAEIAVHLAMTSFAQMQQGKDRRMHVVGNDLGRAAHVLANHPDERMERAKIWERLAKIAQAESVGGLQRHLRNLLGLLRRRDIGVDFGQLALDIYQWQDRANRAEVQRRWSRSFFRARTTEPEPDATDQPA